MAGVLRCEWEGLCTAGLLYPGPCCRTASRGEAEAEHGCTPAAGSALPPAPGAPLRPPSGDAAGVQVPSLGGGCTAHSQSAGSSGSPPREDLGVALVRRLEQ